MSDPNGSKLVEQISKTSIRGSAMTISRAAFNDRQQLALRGAEAVATVIDYDGNSDPKVIDLLIRKCYTWYAARGRVLALPMAGSAAGSTNGGPAMGRPSSNRSLFDSASSATYRAVSH